MFDLYRNHGTSNGASKHPPLCAFVTSTRNIKGFFLHAVQLNVELFSMFRSTSQVAVQALPYEFDPAPTEKSTVAVGMVICSSPIPSFL